MLPPAPVACRTIIIAASCQLPAPRHAITPLIISCVTHYHAHRLFTPHYDAMHMPLFIIIFTPQAHYASFSNQHCAPPLMLFDAAAFTPYAIDYRLFCRHFLYVLRHAAAAAVIFALRCRAYDTLRTPHAAAACAAADMTIIFAIRLRHDAHYA